MRNFKLKKQHKFWMKNAIKNAVSLRNETFSCVIDKQYIPDEYGRAFDKMSIPKRVLKVPTRKNGLTSSGISGQCHANVGLLVQNYGGKAVQGFSVGVAQDGVELYWPCVWLSPEGKLVEVTRQPGFPTYTPFIPCCFWTKGFVNYGANIAIPKNYKKTGILAHPSGQVLTLENNVIIPLSQLSIYEIFHAVEIPEKEQKEVENDYLEWTQHGGFQKNSLATGHYLMGTKALHA